MQIRFWGVRGSIPWATPETIGYGCNTPCVEVLDGASGARLVLDAGSGIVGLGKRMDHQAAIILLTHYHWDHVQGLPFFEPFYRSGCSGTIWGPQLAGCDVSWFESVFRRPFFPVPHDRLPALPAVRFIERDRFSIPPFEIRSMHVTHPGGALALRISNGKGTVVYAPDHEHGDRAVDDALVSFCKGASAVVFDTHFTPDEIESFRGWGHSSWLEAARSAAAADVGRLFLFHHKPGRTDVELDTIVSEARQVFPRADAAREGATIDL